MPHTTPTMIWEIQEKQVCDLNNRLVYNFNMFLGLPKKAKQKQHQQFQSMCILYWFLKKS